MKLTTPVSIPKSKFSISHEQPILLIGSCFAQNIGEQLNGSKFNVNINPNGIIYNPISLVKNLKRIVNNEVYTEKDLILFNDKWISLNHHGSFSSFDKTKCLKQINTSLSETHQQLKDCRTIFITFGSAWVYEYPEVGIVANCHKIPNNQFSKRLLSVKEITASFNSVLEKLLIVNSELEIVLTVSPVRHIKNGLHENNLSKSTLHLAINDIVEQNKNCSYFPAYEMVIDELRDYRFYKDDLVHPAKMATNYVWNKFGECFFNDETKSINTKIQQITTAVNHKPFNFDCEEHQQFIAKQIQLMNELSNKYSFLDFTEDKVRLQNN